MDQAGAARALVSASALLVDRHDVIGSLAALFQSCGDALSVDAVGILIATGGRMELLAASSHDAVELEIHQPQLDEGPCIEAHDRGASTQADSADEVLTRWPKLGRVVVDAGFQTVHASPMRWHRTAVGAMGLFRRGAQPFTVEEVSYAQAFADIATLIVMSEGTGDLHTSSERMERALSGRVVIEQAKGALTEIHQINMAEAYRRVVDSARDQQLTLTAAAEAILREAGRP